MKKMTTLLTIAATFLKVHGQTIDNFAYNYAFPSTTVPEKASLLKYEGFPNIEALGGTKITIPIYSLKLDGLDIPISLNYDTKGIKISEIASNIGLGWSMTGNGSIEYQINDLYDFTAQDVLVNGGYDNTSVRERMLTGYLFPENFGTNMHHRDDASPDFYHINAPGFSNSFYLKKDLSVCPSDNCGYATNQFTPVFFEKDDIKSPPVRRINTISNTDGFDNQTFAFINNFAFTNRKGFTYKFADPIYTSTSNYNTGVLDGSFISGGCFNNTNWKLTQIESPYSTNSITYSYENYTNQYIHPQLIRSNDPGIASGMSLGSIPYAAPSVAYYNTRSTTHYNNTKRLKKITSRDTEIIFNYDDTRQDYAGGALKSVQVKDIFTGKVIKTVNFTQSYFLPKGNNCSDNYDCLRLRLDGVNDSSSGNYILKYGDNNSDYKFPKRSSSKVDFAGYYNDNTSDIQIYSDGQANAVSIDYWYYPRGKVFYYPNLTKDNYIPFALINYAAASTYGSIDLSSNSSSLIGLLTDITYPTGGGMNIQYENDQFNYLGVDYPLGSARIKSMKLYDPSGTLKKINYEYKSDDGTSSGQIAGFVPPTNNGSFNLIVGLEFMNNNTVIYSKVTEKTEGKGKTECYYSNYDEYPNRLGDLGGSIYCYPSPTLTQAQCNAWKQEAIELKFPYLNIYKPDYRRALLKKKSIFNELGEKLQESEMSYTYHENNSLLLSTPFEKSDLNGTGFLYIAGRTNNLLQTYSNNVYKETNREYLNGQIISTETEYTYDFDKNLLKKITGTLPLSKSYKDIKYAEDKNNTILLSANIKTVPVEIKESKEQTGIVKDIAYKENQYKVSSNNKILQSAQLTYNLNDNSVNTEITYDKYDDKGNLQQYTTKSGISTTVIWGYNQTQPIATIEGAKLSDIQKSLIDNIVNASNVESIQGNDTSEQSLITALDVFRKDISLSNYNITTYTYDPLIGITTIIPPTGLKQFYKYDAFKRLEKIVDGNGNIIKEYKYNYAPTTYYNFAKSQTFIKNNCPSGMVSTSSYTYNVSENQYTSIISQADADQKAQDEINMYGQNAANTSGVCYYPYCDFNAQTSSSYISMQYAPFQKVNTVVNAQLNFQVMNNQTVNWSNDVQLGNIPSPCWPGTTVTKTSGNWQITIVQASGQTTLRWIGTGSPSTGTPYNITFNYNVN